LAPPLMRVAAVDKIEIRVSVLALPEALRRELASSSSHFPPTTLVVPFCLEAARKDISLS
jgi:hypothetical protein